MKRSTLRHVTLAAFAAGATLIGVPSADAINIVLNFNAGASQNPSFDSTGAGLQSIMNHVRTFYNNTFLDTHTLTVNYWWEDLTGTTLGLHTLVAQSGGRQTIANIRFDTRVGTGGAERLWYIDPDPTDNSEYDMQQTLWRDLTATQRTNWYNAGTNIPDTFEVGYTGAALATAPNAAQNGFDLLSVAMHEVGHALGMSAANVSTQAETQDGDYDFNSNFVFNRTLAARTASSTNIAHLAANPAVMFPSFNTGQRKLPGDTDLFSMAAGHSYNLVATPRREFYGGSNWNTPGNWSGNRVPGIGTDAWVRNPAQLVTMSLSANGAARDLFVGEGAWVTTGSNSLFIFGHGTIDGSNAGGATTRIRVTSGGTLSAVRVTATSGGTLTMVGGIANVATLTTTGSGGIVGQGTIVITDRLVNNGGITSLGGTLTLNTSGSGTLDLDGIGFLFSPETGSVNATGGNIIVNGPLNDPFNGTINISGGNRLNMNTDWVLAASSGTIIFFPAGRLNLNGGSARADSAVLGGSGPTNLSGIINVSGYGSIAANASFNSPTITIASGGTLLLGNATINGGVWTGDGRIGFDGNTTVVADTTMDVANFDLDGDFLGDTFTINSGATLTVNSQSVTDPFDEFLVVNGRLLMNTSNQWVNNGTITMNTGTIGGSAPLRVTRRINVNSGTSRITADATFASSADVVLNPGSTLNLDGNTVFLGGSYTGAGTLGFNGPQTTVLSSTTFDVATINWDGFIPIGSFTVASGAVATFNANAIETGASDQYDGTTTLNSGTLIVNIPNPYTFAGTLNLNNTGGGTPRLAGQTVKMTGLINSSGSTQITAPIENRGFTVNSASGALVTNGALTTPAGAFTMTKNGPGTWTISGSQSHAPGAMLQVNAGTVVMTSTAHGGGPNLGVNVSGGTVSFNNTQRIAALNVGSGAHVVVPATGRVINTRSLMIDGGSSPTGRVNLFGNAMVIDYTPAAPSPLNTIRDQIATGYNGGAWDGQGIMTSLGNASTHGLGYAESAAIFGAFPANFLGEAVDDTAVLIRYTRYGDANLDGQVNLADFNRLAANFGATNAVWSMGDFNYDGIVNLADFNRLAANFGLVASGTDAPTPDDWSALAAAVPEPGSLLWLSLVALGVRRRRRT